VIPSEDLGNDMNFYRIAALAAVERVRTNHSPATPTQIARVFADVLCESRGGEYTEHLRDFFLHGLPDWLVREGLVSKHTQTVDIGPYSDSGTQRLVPMPTYNLTDYGTVFLDRHRISSRMM